MIVDIFIPCFMDQLFPETALNMVKVLEKAGCGVNYNIEQTCCGQPAFNAGYGDACKEVAQKFIHDFSNDRPIVCPSASCVGMVRNYYPEMFHNSSLHNEFKQVQKNIYEFSDFLVNVLGKTDFGAAFEGTATYHDSCSALRECRIKEEPRILLKNVRGLALKEMEDTETCCGFGGTFTVKYETISGSMAETKINNAVNTGADYLVSTDISCLMHLESYMKKSGKGPRIMHLADVLAQGY
jgi:L-lactate dehydrogenase complex protein LldE